MGRDALRSRQRIRKCRVHTYVYKELELYKGYHFCVCLYICRWAGIRCAPAHRSLQKLTPRYICVYMYMGWDPWLSRQWIRECRHACVYMRTPVPGSPAKGNLYTTSLCMVCVWVCIHTYSQKGIGIGAWTHRGVCLVDPIASAVSCGPPSEALSYVYLEICICGY